jgi:Flp pilus assembly protein CpaB
LVKRKSSIVFLLVAVLCGLIAAVLSGTLLSSYAQMVDVVAVVGDIGPGEQLSAGAVSKVSLPAAAVPADAVLNIADAEGRFLRFGLVGGSVVRTAHLAEGVQGGQLSAALTYVEEPHMRAFAIPFSGIISVGGAITQNDRVDLIAGIVVDEEPVARIIARGVRVLSVIPEGQGVPSVILAVSPEQAEELVFVLENGVLYAALNPFGADTDAAITEGFYTISEFAKRHAGGEVVVDPPEDEPEPAPEEEAVQ